jgi:hypothetical protein
VTVVLCLWREFLKTGEPMTTKTHQHLIPWVSSVQERSPLGVTPENDTQLRAMKRVASVLSS